MKTTYSLLLLLVCFVFYGCTSLDHVEPMKGNIEGYIRLRNVDMESRDRTFITDYSGVNVRLEGLDPAIDVQTNEEGHWIMKDVAAGTYNITYSKEDFETFKQFGVQHLGGNISTFPYLDDFRESDEDSRNFPFLGDRLELFSASKGEIFSLSVKDTTDFGELFVSFGGRNSIDPFGKRILYFFSNRGSASSTSYNFVLAGGVSPGKGSFLTMIRPQVFKQFGYKSGDVISVNAYIAPYRQGSQSADQYSYYDPSLGIRIYTGLSKKGIEVKFTMP